MSIEYICTHASLTILMFKWNLLKVDESAMLEGRCSMCSVLLPIRVLEKHRSLCKGIASGRKRPRYYMYKVYEQDCIKIFNKRYILHREVDSDSGTNGGVTKKHQNLYEGITSGQKQCRCCYMSEYSASYSITCNLNCYGIHIGRMTVLVDMQRIVMLTYPA